MPKVLVERDDRVLVITINRPDVMNAVDGETAEALHRAWLEFRDDDALHAAVLTGAGEAAFSAGADLTAIGTLRPDRAGYLGGTRLADVFKPVVAAVNGHALAGGLELALLADVRVAAENATFGVTCRRWGVPLVDGGTQRLPRAIGLARAMDLIVTGRVIDAREAERVGLASEVVPRGRALARALDVAHAVAALPQAALRADKEAALRGFGLPLADGLRVEADGGERVVRAPDFERDARARFEARPR